MVIRTLVVGRWARASLVRVQPGISRTSRQRCELTRVHGRAAHATLLAAAGH